MAYESTGKCWLPSLTGIGWSSKPELILQLCFLFFFFSHDFMPFPHFFFLSFWPANTNSVMASILVFLFPSFTWLLVMEFTCTSTTFSSSGMLSQSHPSGLHQTGPFPGTAETLTWQLQKGAGRLWLELLFVLLVMQDNSFKEFRQLKMINPNTIYWPTHLCCIDKIFGS